MAFTDTVPAHFPSLYQDEWKLELQQLTSRLQGLVPTYAVQGDSRRFNKLGKVESTPMTGPAQDAAPSPARRALGRRAHHEQLRVVVGRLSP